MGGSYWYGGYMGWGWFLWLGVMILLFSSAASWGYTYRVHRAYGPQPRKDALDILSERYARRDQPRGVRPNEGDHLRDGQAGMMPTLVWTTDLREGCDSGLLQDARGGSHATRDSRPKRGHWRSRTAERL